MMVSFCVRPGLVSEVVQLNAAARETRRGSRALLSGARKHAQCLRK
jgi:hypothetical protein